MLGYSIAETGCADWVVVFFAGSSISGVILSGLNGTIPVLLNACATVICLNAACLAI
jgi:hypothetical protein